MFKYRPNGKQFRHIIKNRPTVLSDGRMASKTKMEPPVIQKPEPWVDLLGKDGFQKTEVTVNLFMFAANSMVL